MRRIALLGIAPLATLIISIFPSAATAALCPQCPAVGLDSGCQQLITVTDSGAEVTSDPAQKPYDGEEDALVGIQNNSSKAIASISLTGE